MLQTVSWFYALVFGMLLFVFVFWGRQTWAQVIESTVLVFTAPTAEVRWAVPQSRVGVAGTNDDTTFYLTVRTSGNDDDVILFTSALATTTNAGTYPTTTLTGVPPGTYDIGFKGKQHLTRVMQDVEIASGHNVLNFSQADNSGSRGDVVLLAGDVSGDATSAATLGDDVVNSIDISLLLDVLDDDDPTGNAVRSNLNQDIVVNSVDLSILLDNIDVEGDN